MKKILSVVAMTMMLMSSAAIASAAPSENGQANSAHGKCTASFSGSENGQSKKRQNGTSFERFLAGTGDYDEDGDIDWYDVAAWCLDVEGGFGNPGQGNSPYFGPDDTCYEGGEEGAPDGYERSEDIPSCDTIDGWSGGTGYDSEDAEPSPSGNNAKKKN